MKSYNSVEEYAAHVRKETSAALGAILHRLGPEHPQARRIVDLCTEAANIVQQKRMQQEQVAPDAYDLAALSASVDASKPSNSETPLEDS